MTRLIKVENSPGLVRDPTSGAILNINTTEIATAREVKARRLEQKQKQAELVNDVNMLKSEMNDIKSLLQQIVEKL